MFARGATAKTGRKFRYRNTDSVKAQRASQAKRKILEEKLQLDWAWMPMAAKMNENSTNQLYWTPPVYNSNILTAITKSKEKVPRYRSRKKKLSSSRRRGKLIADGSFIAEDAIAIVDSIAAHGVSTTEDRVSEYEQMTDENNVTKQGDCDEQSEAATPKYGSTRKKKLSSSRRRSRTASDDSPPDNTIPDDNTPDDGLPEDSIQEDPITDVMNVITHSPVTVSLHSSTRKKKLSSSRRRSSTQSLLSANSNITGEIKDEALATTLAVEDSNTDILTNNDMKYEESEEEGGNKEFVKSPNNTDTKSKKEFNKMDIEKNTQNNLINNTSVLGQCHQCNLKKPKNLTSSPTVLKLLEKISNISILPGIMQTKKNNFGLRKVASAPQPTLDRKHKRPSIKVYQGYNKNKTTRSNPSIRSTNKYNRKSLVIKTDSQVPNKTIVRRVNSNESKSDFAESGIFEESDIDVEDKVSDMENLSNAQLKTLLYNLTKVYDEKLSHRDTEIKHLRNSVQTQEKLLMQLVHVTMGMKSDIDRFKKNNKIGTNFMVVNEELPNCEHLDNEISVDDNTSDNYTIGSVQNTDLNSKMNVTTIEIRDN